MRLHRHIMMALAACTLAMLAKGADEPVYHVKFRTYPLGDTYPEKLFYRSAPGEVKAVRVLKNKGMRSPEHSYVGPNPIRLYRIEENEDGTKVPIEVATVDISGNDQEYLLLLAYSRNHPDKLYIQRIRDDWDSFPTSHVQLVNACPETIYIGMGKNRIKLVPGQVSKPYAFSGNSDKGIPVGIARQADNGEFVLMLQNRWRFNGDSRQLIVLTPKIGASEDSMSVYRVSESKNI